MFYLSEITLGHNRKSQKLNQEKAKPKVTTWKPKEDKRKNVVEGVKGNNDK